ncbi:MAG: isoprenylcysteine carboxylmethyltransferase family protein [Pseudomonadales bacterium]
MQDNVDKKGPGVKIPPPLIFLFCLILGYALESALPVNTGPALWGKLVGVFLVTTAAVVLLYLLITYLRAKTSIEPWKPTSHLITSGLYAYSRNPIYTVFCLLNIGVGCYLNSLWITLSFLPAAVLVYYTAIRREEAYLENKFGEQYLSYKRSVRRWL